MMTSSSKQVTILVPNYKTPEVTKICMRLLRKHTNFEQAEIIVIDNDSQDDSLLYLRSLPWITLIERQAEADDIPMLSHSRALDLALARVNTPYVLSIHTDTFVKRDDWLEVLLKPFQSNPKLAGVGSWKLEFKTPLQRLGTHLERTFKIMLYHNFSVQRYNPSRYASNQQYLRSHCALYRTDVIKALNTNFSDQNLSAGRVMHQKMVSAGYEMLFLEPAELGLYVDHLNHATQIFNPELGTNKRNIRVSTKRIKKMLRGIDASAILKNASLDT